MSSSTPSSEASSSLTNEAAAKALAKEFGIEEEAGTVEKPLIDRLQFETLRTLSPGQDYVNGVLYYTAPAYLQTTKKVGRGKETREVPTNELYTACLTSEEELFTYEELELYDRGFMFPEVFSPPRKERWGGEILRVISRGEAEYPEPLDLYMRIRKVYEQYMEYADEMYYDIMTCWLLGSYMFKVFRTYAYLHFNGTKDSGKSQNLRILKALGFNTHWTSEMTAADLYRSIAGNPGVVCIDEQEKWRGERAEALQSILRAGYGEGVEVTRQRQQADNRWTQDSFAIYCPKALASINPLDDTTQSRTIIVQMRPALRNIIEFKSNDTDRWGPIRDSLHLWGLRHAAPVSKLYEDWSNTTRLTRASGLNNRSWEISAAIITVADYIGGESLSQPIIDWLDNYFQEQRRKSDSNDITRLLAISLPSLLRVQMAREGWYYPLQNVLDNLKTFLDEDATERLTTRGLLKSLAPLGFTDHRAEKGGRVIKIEEDELRKVFKERRIEARLEDTAWLDGEESLQTEDSIMRTEIQSSIAWGDDEPEG
jgi:hypothetical protein